MYQYLRLVFTMLFLVSCKATELTGKETAGSGAANAAAADTAGSRMPAAKQGRQMLSIILHAKGDAANTTWSIDEAVVKDGYFKKGNALHEPRYLTAYFTDDAGRRVDSTFFEHPLARRIEYPAAEDGKLTAAINKTTDGAAHLRANYRSDITAVQLYDAAGKKTATFYLNEYLKK